MNRLLLILATTLPFAACQPAPSDNGTPEPAPVATPPSSAAPLPVPTTTSTPVEPAPLAAALIRAEWSRADNRESCAPLAFTTDAGHPATARRATFSGGWAVAFDTAEIRSAYGVAGAGLIDSDTDAPAAQAERLGAQWPHFTTLAALPAPAFAGYGVEGAGDYPAGNADGRGLNSLAYLRVGDERCTYNVWSRLGRAHLEALLVSLRKL